MVNFYLKVKRLFYYLFLYPIYRFRFKKIGLKSSILSPLNIDGYSNISIGNYVIIGKKSWIASKPLCENQTPNLIIEDGCVIGNFNHIYATDEIVIEKNVLTADKVYISDCSHCFEDISTPILKQPIKQLSRVRIGEGSWIGENVCIMGASVGKGCVIGANSVVNKDIPDYSVAVGIPARVIRRYDKMTKEWVKV